MSCGWGHVDCEGCRWCNKERYAKLAPCCDHEGVFEYSIHGNCSWRIGGHNPLSLHNQDRGKVQTKVIGKRQ